MEQNLAPYQYSTVGNQTPSGLRFKKGIKLGMALAVCIWLLHQIKEPSVHTQDLDRPKPNQAVKEDGNMVLGRKWKVGLMDGGNSESENGGVGDEDGYDRSELDGGFRDENGIPGDGFERREYGLGLTEDSDYYSQ